MPPWSCINVLSRQGIVGRKGTRLYRGQGRIRVLSSGPILTTGGHSHQSFKTVHFATGAGMVIGVCGMVVTRRLDIRGRGKADLQPVSNGIFLLKGPLTL